MVKEFCSECGGEIHFRVWRYIQDDETRDKRLAKMVFCNVCGRAKHKGLNPGQYGLISVCDMSGSYLEAETSGDLSPG
ncbi:hypothetical protein ACFLU4_05415 [Chloroflexota bacterium]